MKTEQRKKLFRSIEGCTVCKVKSTRHAFQESKKWSKYLLDVFKLNDNRTNEICYFCLKLLRKWRRAGKNSKPDFSNVVDSKHIEKKAATRKRRHSSLIEMEIGTKEENKVALMEEDDLLSDTGSSESDYDSSGVPDTYFDTPSPNSNGEDNEDDVYVPEFSKSTQDASCQTSFLFPSITSPQASDLKLPYIDLSKWRQEQICCGVIFRGPSGEVLVDPKWLNPLCSMCNRSCMTPTSSNLPQGINPFDEKLLQLIQSSS